MKLLVTGGAGFIGSNFIRYWLKNHLQDEIVNYDKLTYAGHLSSTKDFKDIDRYRLVKGDVLDTKKVAKAIKGADYVVHFAAESHVDRSISGPKVFLETNVLGTQVLLDAALKEEVKRFHHISTDEVFGSLSLKSKEKFSEKTAYAPHSPYAASKASSDHLVRSYHTTYGLDTTITNCSNNFGPFQDPEKFLPRMITNLIDDQQLPIYGDGKNVRNWLYVEDHCKAIDLVLTKGKSGDTYCVGGGKKDINNLEIAKELIKIFQKDDSYLKFVTDRKGHDRKYAVNWGKIKRQLGWKPRYDFSKGIEKTIEWYKDNEWWWRPLKKEAEKLYQKTGQN